MVAYTNSAILAGSKSPDAAKLFIDFVTSPAGQLAIGNINIRFPINTNVQSTYNLATALQQYLPGVPTYQDPDRSILLTRHSIPDRVYEHLRLSPKSSPSFFFMNCKV